MCGLTGFLSSSAQLGEGIALGHRYIFILDLTVASAQPMLSASGRLQQ